MRADQVELHKQIGALNDQVGKQTQEMASLQREMSQIKSLLEVKVRSEKKPKDPSAVKEKKGKTEKVKSEKKTKPKAAQEAPQKESGKKRGRPPKVRTETAGETVAPTEGDSVSAKSHADSALRVRDRFYYATFQAPPGTLGDDPESVERLLVSNFNRLCGRDSYQIGSAACAFEDETLTLHCILRGSISLPTTSGALGNCNRTSLLKEKGKAVEYYSEGIKLIPLNRGKGGFITNQILDSVLNFLAGFGPLEGSAGKPFDQADLADGVPDELEIEAIHRNTFDAASRQMLN